MFYIDWTYIVLVMPALILAMAAQGKVSSTFNKYSRVQSHNGSGSCKTHYGTERYL